MFALAATMYRLLAGAKLFGGLKLSQQVAMCGSSSEFELFVQQRVSGLAEAGGPARRLLCDCLSWDPARRPDARQVGERATVAALDLPGPDLVGFARSLPRSKPVEPPGTSWVGRTIRDEALPDVVPPSLAPTMIQAVGPPPARSRTGGWRRLTVGVIVAVLIGVLVGTLATAALVAGLWATM